MNYNTLLLIDMFLSLFIVILFGICFLLIIEDDIQKEAKQNVKRQNRQTNYY